MKRLDTDSSLETRVIVSARSWAQESWRMRGQACAAADDLRHFLKWKLKKPKI